MHFRSDYCRNAFMRRNDVFTAQSTPWLALIYCIISCQELQIEWAQGTQLSLIILGTFGLTNAVIFRGPTRLEHTNI